MRVVFAGTPEVAVPAPLAHALTYEVPAAMAGDVAPGARVLCELGRRKVAAVVLDVREGEAPLDVALNLAGEHNVRNALAAIAVADELGAPDDAIVAEMLAH